MCDSTGWRSRHKKAELFSMELNDKVIHQTTKISSGLFFTENILGVGEKIHFFKERVLIYNVLLLSI